MANQRLAFQKRLNEVCDDLKIVTGRGRQTALGKMFKVSQQAAGQWLTGETMPTLEKCQEIAIKAKCGFEWFMTGRGPKVLAITASRPKLKALMEIAEQLGDYKINQLIKISATIAEPDPNDGDGEDDSVDETTTPQRKKPR